MGDFHTKFHYPSHHKKESPLHTHTEASQKDIPCDMSTLQQGCVKSFPDNNIINSIQRKPEFILVKIINGYNNLDRTEITHGTVLSACK